MVYLHKSNEKVTNMERYTKMSAEGVKAEYSDYTKGNFPDAAEAVLQRLYEYEVTGLTPSQVEQESIYSRFFSDHNLSALKTAEQLSRWAEQIRRNNNRLKMVTAQLEEFKKKQAAGPCDACESRRSLEKTFGANSVHFLFCPKCGRDVSSLPEEDLTQEDLSEITGNITKLLDEV